METSVREQRRQFAVAYASGVWSMTELCERYGITRPTGYKWVTRWEAAGAEGLADQARAMLDEMHGIAKDDDDYSRFGGRQSFDREMLESIEQPKRVWDEVEQSLKDLKVPPRVPVEEFVL